jgi:hypothetical protein
MFLLLKPFPLSVESPPFRARDDAKWKIKENEWYLYGLNTFKIKLNIETFYDPLPKTLKKFENLWIHLTLIVFIFHFLEKTEKPQENEVNDEDFNWNNVKRGNLKYWSNYIGGESI